MENNSSTSNHNSRSNHSRSRKAIPATPRRRLSAVLLMTASLAAILSLSSCRHKDLSYEQNRNARLNVIFDWSKAPDAEPASMAFYLYSPDDGGKPVRYIFQDNTGGYLRVVSGDYHTLCLNADLTDWAVIDGEDNIDGFALSTLDAEALSVSGIPSRAIPRAPASDGERMAHTPGMLWADRIDSISLPASYETRTITMYPEEKVCHYIVDVYDSGDVSRFPGGIDATLSGMAEAYNIGKDKATEIKVTHPFTLSPVASDNSLHAEFLTFGEADADPAHTVSLYLTTADGKPWNCNVDVTKAVHEAPDPHHVHIILRGISLPDPPKGGVPFGVVPDVEEWQTVNITLKM